MNIDEHRIRNVFDQLNLAKIGRVDILERKNERGELFKRVFIHFEFWFQTPESFAARQKLNEGKELKIVYDDPWFWKASMNNWNCDQSKQQPIPRPVARIDWEDDRRPVRQEKQRSFEPRPYQRQDQKDQREYQRQDQREYQRQDQREEPKTQKYNKRQEKEERRQEKEKEERRQKVEKNPRPSSKQNNARKDYSVPIQSQQLPVKKRLIQKKPEKETVPVIPLEEGEVSQEEVNELYGGL
jgi:hypothetical protein